MKELNELISQISAKVSEVYPDYTELVESLDVDNKSTLLFLITSNWRIMMRSNRIINARFLEENFTEDELIEHNIYTKGTHKVRNTAYVCGTAEVGVYESAYVEAYDHATIRVYQSESVKAYGDVFVEAYNNSEVSAFDNVCVEAYASSSVDAFDNAMVKSYNSSMINAFDSSSVKGYNHSIIRSCDDVTVMAYDYSIVYARDNSSIVSKGYAVVNAYDNSKVESWDCSVVRCIDHATVKAQDGSYIEDFTGKVRDVNNLSIVKDRNNHKIYIKKGAYDIVEID